MIKKIDVVSIIAIVTGFILVAIYIYRSSLEIDMPIPFEKIGIGSMIAAVLLSIISGIKKENKYKTCISSYITPFYKILSIPFLASIALILIFFIYKLNGKGLNDLILFLLFIVFSIFFASYYYSKIIFKLKWVEYDKNIITIYGIFNAVTKPITDINGIKRADFTFYRIEFYDKSVVYVFPKMFDFFLNLGGEPDSIKKLRKLIEINKDKS